MSRPSDRTPRASLLLPGCRRHTRPARAPPANERGSRGGIRHQIVRVNAAVGERGCGWAGAVAARGNAAGRPPTQFLLMVAAAGPATSPTRDGGVAATRSRAGAVRRAACGWRRRCSSAPCADCPAALPRPALVPWHCAARAAVFLVGGRPTYPVFARWLGALFGLPLAIRRVQFPHCLAAADEEAGRCV